MPSMASLVFVITSFFLVICMHFSNARHLPAIVKPSSARPLHFSISLQDSEKRSQNRPPATPFLKGESGKSLTGNAQEKKQNIDGVFKEGSEIVESSSSHHHVALLKGKHVEAPEKPCLPHEYHGKEEDINFKNDDIVVVMDYQPPHRKTPIHNK